VSSDAELVERARTGDRQAFRALFLTHRNATARLLSRLVPAPEVEDVVQEVFLQVHRSLDAFRGESRFSTWLYRLTMNVARMHLRRQRSRPKLTLAGQDEAGQLERPELETPEREAERNERMRALDRLLACLSEKKREALVLHDFQGVPADEIAKLLEVPVMTVRTRIFYGRRELYAALAQEPVLAALVQSLLSASEAPVQARRAAREQESAAPGKAASAESRALRGDKP
jgi:RNA polymerase sigma-70 factor (ECF subfamily)